MSFETRARTLAFLRVPKLISGRSIAIFFLATNSCVRGRTESTSIIESRLASADWLPVEPRLLSRVYYTMLIYVTGADLRTNLRYNDGIPISPELNYATRSYLKTQKEIKPRDLEKY